MSKSLVAYFSASDATQARAAGSAICFLKGIDRSMKSYYNIEYDFILKGEQI